MGVGVRSGGDRPVGGCTTSTEVEGDLVMCIKDKSVRFLARLDRMLAGMKDDQDTDYVAAEALFRNLTERSSKKSLMYIVKMFIRELEQRG